MISHETLEKVGLALGDQGWHAICIRLGDPELRHINKKWKPGFTRETLLEYVTLHCGEEYHPCVIKVLDENP